MVAAGFSLRELLVGAQHAEPKEFKCLNRRGNSRIAQKLFGAVREPPLHIKLSGTAVPFPYKISGRGKPCPYK